MNRFGVFSIEDAREIHRKVFGQQPTSSPENIQRRHTTSADMYYVKMLADLPAATNPETGYTQADGLIVRYKIPAEDTLDREVAPDTAENREKITNRSTSFSAKTGDYIWVKRAGSEYIPLHSGGGQNSPSDKCPCYCVATPSLVVGTGPDAVETVICWRVTLPEMEFELSDGTALLAADDYDICWDANAEKWMLDIGDALSVFNAVGQDITASAVVDGQISIELLPDKTSVFRICVTVTTTETSVESGYSAGYTYGYANGSIDGTAGNPYDDRVIFAGSTGTSAGTGQYQQFGTGTNLEPATGTYGDMTGTGTGTGTFMWSDYEEGFYQGYKDGYFAGYGDGQIGTGSQQFDFLSDSFYTTLDPDSGLATGTGSFPDIDLGTGTGTAPESGTGGQFE